MVPSWIHSESADMAEPELHAGKKTFRNPQEKITKITGIDRADDFGFMFVFGRFIAQRLLFSAK